MSEKSLPRADVELLIAYQKWSKLYYAAGFLSPDSYSVGQFRKWFTERSRINRELESYELEFLAEFHRQDTEEVTA